MRRIAVLVAAFAAAAVTLGAFPARGLPKLTDEEAAFCAEELDVLERREGLFEGQGLPASEIARRTSRRRRIWRSAWVTMLRRWLRVLSCARFPA